MTTSLQDQIDAFLDGAPHAVVGASQDRAKYGNKTLRVYQQRGRLAYPVNPNANRIEGVQAFPTLTALPEPVHGISIITPPAVTVKVIDEAGRLGIKHVWMQPGAENELAVAKAVAFGMNVIHGGPCILVVLGYRER